MATLYKRPRSPFWWVYYRSGAKTVRVSTEVRHEGKSRPQPAASAIQRAIEDRLARTKFGLEVPPEEIDLGRFKEEYLAGLSCREASRNNISGVLGAFIKWSESVPGIRTVSDVTRAVTARFIGERRADGLKESSLKFYCATLAAAWEEAKRRNHARFEDNPWRMEFKVEKARVEPFSDDDLARLFSSPGPRWIHIALRLGLATGARIGTVRGLDWSHVDFEAGVIHFPDSKTGSYDMPMATELSAYLAQFRRPSGPVMPELHGFNWGYASVTFNRWASVALGRPVHFHMLRHTFVTKLQRAGIPERISMALANHAGRDIHAHYSHTRAAELRPTLDNVVLFPKVA